MKIKNLIYSSVLAMIAVGCSSDEVLLTPETMEKPISFNAFTNNLTRVENHYTATDLPKSFKVWAFVDQETRETKYIDGVKVNYVADDENHWVPETSSTWPLYDLQFYAFVDYDGELNEFAVPNYKIKENVSEQLDFMYAVARHCNEEKKWRQGKS